MDKTLPPNDALTNNNTEAAQAEPRLKPPINASAKRFLDKFHHDKSEAVKQELQDIAKREQLQQDVERMLDEQQDANVIQLDGARSSVEQFLASFKVNTESEDSWLRAAQYGSPEGAALLAHSRKMTEPMVSFQLYMVALQLISNEME